MTPAQLAYVQRRRRQIRYWPYMAAGLILLLGACYAYLFFRNPIYVNPMAFITQLQAHQLGIDQLATLAALGNLAFIACGLFILLLIALTSLSLWNELRLIRMLEAEQGADAAAVPPPDDD